MSEMPSEVLAVSAEDNNNNNEEEEVLIEVIECELLEDDPTNEEIAHCLLCGATVVGGSRMPVDRAHRTVCLERLALIDDVRWATIKTLGVNFNDDVYFCPSHHFGKGSAYEAMRRRLSSYPRLPPLLLEVELTYFDICSSLARLVRMPMANLLQQMLTRDFDQQTRRRVMEIRWMGEEEMKDPNRGKRQDIVEFVPRPSLKGILNPDQEELQCPECDFRSRAIRAWSYHLSAVHGTNPRKLGIALRCECGNESFSDGHIRKCSIAKVTIISRSAGPKCMFCEVHPKTASGYAHHLTYHHKTSLRKLRMFIKCSCGHRVTSHTTDPEHTKVCGGYEFTLEKINEASPEGAPAKKKEALPMTVLYDDESQKETCILDDDYNKYNQTRKRKKRARETITMDDIEAVELIEEEVDSQSADREPVKSSQPGDLQVEFIGTIDDSVIVSIDRNGVERRVKVEKQSGISKQAQPTATTASLLTGREMKRNEELPEFFVVKRPRPDPAEPAEPVETSMDAYPDSFRGVKMCKNHVVMHDYCGEEQNEV